MDNKDCRKTCKNKNPEDCFTCNWHSNYKGPEQNPEIKALKEIVNIYRDHIKQLEEAIKQVNPDFTGLKNEIIEDWGEE